VRNIDSLYLLILGLNMRYSFTFFSFTFFSFQFTFIFIKYFVFLIKFSYSTFLELIEIITFISATQVLLRTSTRFNIFEVFQIRLLYLSKASIGGHKLEEQLLSLLYHGNLNLGK